MISIERIAPIYRSLTCPQIAKLEGTNPALVRKTFSLHGITDPKRVALEKRKTVVLKLYGWGWNYAEIAEQCECSRAAIRMLCKRMGLTRKVRQLSLWDDTEFRIAAPPLRLIHSARQHAPVNCLQLSLFPELVQHAEAA